MRVAHLTTAHPRTDIRIFLKQCCSLAKAGHAVTLIVADGKGDNYHDGVRILDAGASRGRLDRMRHAAERVQAIAQKLDADIYNLHDPELIPVGLKLKRGGRVVIFDAHEDVPKQFLHKPYLNKPLRWLISNIFAGYERWACSRFDGIVTATPSIRDKFLSINSRVMDVNNFPLPGELAAGKIDWAAKEARITYVGGISKIRGIVEIVQALDRVRADMFLTLCGSFSGESLNKTVQALPGWEKVEALGFLDRSAVREILARSMAGIVTFHPLPNHIDSQPNKMFEYMSAGLPVIASHFPLWREIIEGNDCGICVNPLNPEEIAAAIDFLINNPHRAEQMGNNGQQAVLKKYNWSVEEQKLLKFYDQLSN